jgi:hypothetical protein
MTTDVNFTSYLSKRALNGLLGTLAEMTLQLLSSHVQTTLVGTGHRCFRALSLMTIKIVFICSFHHHVIVSCDCFVCVLEATEFTLVWPKVARLGEMIIQISTFHYGYSPSMPHLFTFIGALYHLITTPTVSRLQMLFQCPQLSSPLAALSMVTALYLELVHLAPQAFVDHVVKSFSLSSAVRAVFFALPSEPLVETRLAKVLTAAHG